MSEGTSEASAAKKSKLGQRFRPEYSSLALNNRNPSSAYHYAILTYNEASK
jgi:hypothetical protein